MDSSHTQVLEKFFLTGTLRTITRGEIILRPDQNVSFIFYIAKGHIKAYEITEWGDEKIISIFKKNELFPIVSIFDNKPLSKFYEALDTVSLRLISKKELFRILYKDQKMLLAITNYISEVLDNCYDRINNLEYTNAHDRFCSRLLTLAKRFGQSSGNSVIISIPITHQDIASSVAMTRESASRIFEKLTKNNIVEVKNHLIVIKNIDVLRKEISSSKLLL